MLKAVSLVLILFSILAFLTNCDKSSTGMNQDPVPDVTGIWRGDYFSASNNDSGTFVMEIIQNGDGFSGEAVMKSFLREDKDYLFIKGTVSKNELTIELNNDKIPYQYTFMLHAALLDSQQFAGDFFYSPDNLNATIRCEKLNKGRSEIIDSFEVSNASVIAMAFDGNYIWLSTSLQDYFKLTAAHAIVDTVIVYIERDLHWISSTLASDGIFLWGHFPSFVADRAEARILKFNQEGNIVKDFRLSHIPSGLAFDGYFLWSINQPESRLYKFDATGNLYENFCLNLPDVNHLEYGNNHFWTLGWFFKKLFKLDKTGKAIAVYDLPRDSQFFSQGGIAFDGTYMWYARNYSPDQPCKIYKLSLN